MASRQPLRLQHIWTRLAIALRHDEGPQGLPGGLRWGFTSSVNLFDEIREPPIGGRFTHLP